MFSTHVSSFCLTRHIDITGVFRILHTGVHGTNGPMVNTLVIDIMPPKSVLWWWWWWWWWFPCMSGSMDWKLAVIICFRCLDVISDGIFNESF